MSVQETCTASVATGALSATTTVYLAHGQPGEWSLTGITLVPQAATTADGSHKYVIAFTQGSDTVATSHDTSATALVAGTAQAMTVTTTAGAAAEFGATDAITVVCTETGTATMSAVIVAAFERVRV
mgnify:CR=1 FL=1